VRVRNKKLVACIPSSKSNLQNGQSKESVVNGGFDQSQNVVIGPFDKKRQNINLIALNFRFST
jgi:hypothetical protein